MNYGETVKCWMAEIDGTVHSFRFEHWFWTDRKRDFVDGDLLEHVRGGPIEANIFRPEPPFPLGEHRGVFRYRASTYDARHGYTLFVRDLGILTNVDLYIDDRKISGDKQQAARCAPWVVPAFLPGLIGLAVWLARSGRGTADNSPRAASHGLCSKHGRAR